MPGIADYFATLRLNSDKRTFDMGNKDLERTEKNLRKMGESTGKGAKQTEAFTKNLKNFSSGMSRGGASTETLNKALGVLEVGTMGWIGVAGLAVGAFAAVEAGAFALAAATGKSSQNLIGQAASTGLGVDALMKWHRAAQMIGMDSGAMDSTFSSMRMQAAQFKTWGDLNADQLKNLAMLGEQQGGGKGFVDKWLGMNPEQKVRAVFQVAQGMKDVDKAALLVNQTLGGSGENLFWSLAGRGKGLEGLLNESSKIGLVKPSDVKRSAAFGDEMSEAGAILKEFKDLLGSELARGFMKPLGDFITWYKENKDGVRHTAEYISDSLSAPVIIATQGLGGWATTTAKREKERLNETPWTYDEITKNFKLGKGSFSREWFKKDLSIESILAALNNKGSSVDYFAPMSGPYSKEMNEQYGDKYYLNGAEIRITKEDAEILKRIFVNPNWIGVTK